MNLTNSFSKIAEKLKIRFMNFTKKYTKTKMSIFSSHIGSELLKECEIVENEVRLIDANKYQFPGDLINEPTIKAKEIVIAEWEIERIGLYAEFYCSACKGWEHRYAYEHEKINYCPNCGAQIQNNGG